MKKTILATLLLILAACSPEIRPAITAAVSTPTATEKPASAATVPAVSTTTTPDRFHAITITGDVYVRDVPDGVRIGYAEKGSTTKGVCDKSWCFIVVGYVWRGCTDDNPEGLGCLPK